MNGVFNIAADKGVGMATGTGSLTSGAGAVAPNGPVAIAADKDLVMATDTGLAGWLHEPAPLEPDGFMNYLS